MERAGTKVEEDGPSAPVVFPGVCAVVFLFVTLRLRWGVFGVFGPFFRHSGSRVVSCLGAVLSTQGGSLAFSYGAYGRVVQFRQRVLR